MTEAVTLYAPTVSRVAVGGVPVFAMYGPLNGGRITNPTLAQDQGILVAEPLYISVVGLAGLVDDGSTFALPPGATYYVPALTTRLSVNAATSGHRFSAVVYQGPNPYVPPPDTGFPPSGPTTMTKVIPSYLYKEYDDDDDLQAFVDSMNALAQGYVDWFASVGLPVYTGPLVQGALLDWVALGLYGMSRPVLPSGRNQNLGPLNTYQPNVLRPNQVKIVGSGTYYATTDDVFKRILTWHLYKGDGKVFTVSWLKRRIMRFLLGVDGTDPPVSSTDQVSVSFGVGDQVNIRILNGIRTVTGGAFPNRCGLNTTRPNQLNTSFQPLPQLPFAVILKAAIDSGVLELPFQFTYVVVVAT